MSRRVYCCMDTHDMIRLRPARGGCGVPREHRDPMPPAPSPPPLHRNAKTSGRRQRTRLILQSASAAAPPAGRECRPSLQHQGTSHRTPGALAFRQKHRTRDAWGHLPANREQSSHLLLDCRTPAGPDLTRDHTIRHHARPHYQHSSPAHTPISHSCSADPRDCFPEPRTLTCGTNVAQAGHGPAHLSPL